VGDEAIVPVLAAEDVIAVGGDDVDLVVRDVAEVTSNVPPPRS
jgi:hypothetical protein